QKQGYIDQVNNAKTGDEITKIVDAAKAADQKAGSDKLAEEKKAAIDQINSAKTLNEKQKQDYINQVRNAETSSGLGKIMQQTKLPQTNAKNQLTIGALISIALVSIFSLPYVLGKKHK
ncbi:protease, partial [Weissella kandleri]